MSQHPSLSSSDKDKGHRSVLKRYEKIKILKEKEKWQEDKSVYGLPKVKVMKFKIKKEKAAPAEAAGEAAPGTETAQPAAGVQKTAPGAKGAPAKEGARAQDGKKESK